MSKKHAVLHVVQADDGEALVLEYDTVQQEDSETTKFMLIDGGARKKRAYYGEPSIAIPKLNLFYLLNWLSGNGGTKPKWGVLQELDTVVVTHDDDDHKQGIQDLFTALLRDPADTTKTDLLNIWKQGDTKIRAGKAPVKHIWYNSLKNIEAFNGVKDGARANWFDQQLAEYALKNLTPVVNGFNDEFVLPTGSSAALILKNGKAKDHPGSNVAKGQFTFQFYGPLADSVRAEEYIKDLGAPSSLNLPEYRFTAILTKKNDGWKGKFANRSQKLAIIKAIQNDEDTSVKNLSSIAFVADDQAGTSVLLPSDAVASSLFQRSDARQFTLMKVMHHGSYRNNFWNRDNDRKNEENRLPADRATFGINNFLRDVVFFFAKMPSNKYVISANPSSPHPNFHITTLLGISIAARENAIVVNVYLTNPLSPRSIGLFGTFLRENGFDLTQTNIWLLKEGSKFGSVALYDTEEDKEWEKYEESGSNIWTTYAGQIKKDFAGTAQFRVSLDAAVALYPPNWRRRKQPGKGSEAGENMIRATATNLDVVQPVLTPVTELIDIGTQPYPTQTLSDFPSTLVYFVSQNAMTSGQAQKIESEASISGGLSLAAIATLFMGSEQSEAFLASLPCDLENSTDYLTSDISPYHWIVTDFVAEVVDSTQLPLGGPDFTGWRGLYSVGFTITSSSGTVPPWNIPFGSASPDQLSNTYHFVHDGAISVLILWPWYVARTIYGNFRGMLQSSAGNYHLIGQLKMLYKQATQYDMKFGDDNYSTQDYTLSIGDVLRLFNSSEFNFGGQVSQVLIPGLEQILSGLNDSLGLHNGGFVLEKMLSKVFLKQVSAIFPFDNIPAWKPFGSTNFSLNVSTLRTIVDDVGSASGRQLLLQFDGDMYYAGSQSDMVIPFQLTAQFIQGLMLFEISILPGLDDSLSIGQFLQVVGVTSPFDLESIFPGMSNLSNALNLSDVTAGWYNGVSPDYMKLTILIDDWTIMENVLSIRDALLKIQVDSLSSNNPTQLSLHGQGILDIGDIEVEVSFDILHDHSDSVNDIITFRIASGDRVIPLGSIMAHFFEENFTLLPDAFASLLEETDMDNFTLQAIPDANGWTISQLQVAMCIHGKIDIYDGFDLAYPTLLVDIGYPFDQKKRTVSTTVQTIVHVGDIACNTQITLVSAEATQIAVIFSSDGQPLTPQAVLSQFLPSWPSGSLSLPPSISFLLSLGIVQGTVMLDLVDGKFLISGVTFNILSTGTLSLWEELTLERVSLFFSYSKTDGKNVEFDAMLSFAEGTDFLHFTLLYNESPLPPPLPTTPIDQNLISTVAEGGSWTATTTYEGTISVLDILSRVSGIDIRKELGSVSLSVLAEVIDISATNLTISLVHNPLATSFSFNASTTWLFFSHLRFACSKSTSWSYSFGFDIAPDINIFDKIPLLGSAIGNIVSFTDVSIVVFNRILDPGALPPTFDIPTTIIQNGLNVAFAGKLNLGGKLAGLSKVVGQGTIDILGVIGDNLLSLSASTKVISLFNDCMSISGSVVVVCSQETNMLPKIGIQGDAVLNFGEHISKNPINTSLFFFVDTSTSALGFEFILDTWEGVFGFDCLSFEDVIFAAEFPPEQFPIPSSFTVKGSVNLQVNDAKFDGSVNIHFVEVDFSESFASGNINGLTLNNIISAFTSADNVPDYLDVGFGPLDFRIIPKDIYDHGVLIKQEFAMKGSMHLRPIDFEASVDVDITSSKVAVDGYISPVVVLSQPKLFSITASPEQDPPPPAGTGASVHISAGKGASSPFTCFISGQITFLGFSNDIFFDLSPKGLAFTLDRNWVVGGSVSGVIDSTHLELSASVDLSLQLTLPAVRIGSISLGDINIATFSASLDVNVNWSNPAWSLSITGYFALFELEMDKTFTVGGDVQDVAAMASYISDQIRSTFKDDFVQGVRAIRGDLNKVIDLLKHIGLSVGATLKFLIETCEVALSNAARAIKDHFKYGWEELVSIMRDVGTTAAEVVQVLKAIGCEAYDAATALAKAFGSAVRNLCGTLLKEAGHAIDQIAKFFQEVFNDPAQAIVDILILLDFNPFAIFKAIFFLFELSADELWRLINSTTTKKTRDQVQDELLLMLVLNVNQQLTKPIVVTDGTQLPTILSLYATAQFKQVHGYEFAGANTRPPLAITPLVVKGMVNILNIIDNTTNTLPGFVDKIIVKATLDSWMSAPARNDLLTTIQTLFVSPKRNDWSVAVVRQSYDPSDDTDHSVVTNAVIVFVNGALSHDGWNVTQTTMYYMGVYFNTLPPGVIARAELRKIAYERASKLTSNNPSVADDASLAIALELFGRKKFADHFLFDYQSKPPDFPTSNNTFLDVNSYVLGSFDDLGTSTISSIVRDKFFSKLSVPNWVKQEAITDLINVCQSGVTNGTSGAWKALNVERSYDPPADIVNPIECKAIVAYYTDTKTTQQSIKVSISYIFILGVFYEISPPKTVISGDLVKLLYNNLMNDMHETPEPSITPTLDTLKSSLGRYARIKFSTAFACDYAGNDTVPKDKLAGEVVYGTESFYQFQDRTDANEATEWLDSAILLFSGTTNTPSLAKPSSHWGTLVPAIRTGLLKEINTLTGATDLIANQWLQIPFKGAYNHPTDSSKIIQTNAILIYTNGVLSEKKTTVQMNPLYYLGTYYVTDNVGW